MEGLIILGIILGNIAIIGAIWYLSMLYYNNIYEQTKHKITDAEIFKLMARANHFITNQQLANASSLTEKEAGTRLASLALQGTLRRYYDSTTGMSGVYQLLEDVPLFDSLPAEINGLSEEEIIEVVLLHVDDYQLTIPELMVIFGIDIAEAKIILNRLKQAGKLTTLRKGFRKIYAIKKPLNLNSPTLRTTPKKKDHYKIALPDASRIKIPDADVLQLAINHKGRLTPTLLCVKLQISMDEAKMKLEELYEQGVFVMEIDEENAVMEYQLIDKTLLM